jgi:hypothetical protein
VSSGGPRPGGGRPKGSKDGPHTLRGTKARAYKELYEEEAVKVLCNLRPNAHVTEAHKRSAVRRLVMMQVRFAVVYRDSRSLHDMMERICGKVVQPLEHGGPQGGPLKIVEVLLSRDEPPV